MCKWTILFHSCSLLEEDANGEFEPVCNEFITAESKDPRLAEHGLDGAAEVEDVEFCEDFLSGRIKEPCPIPKHRGPKCEWIHESDDADRFCKFHQGYKSKTPPDTQPGPDEQRRDDGNDDDNENVRRGREQRFQQSFGEYLQTEMEIDQQERQWQESSRSGETSRSPGRQRPQPAKKPGRDDYMAPPPQVRLSQNPTLRQSNRQPLTTTHRRYGTPIPGRAPRRNAPQAAQVDNPVPEPEGFRYPHMSRPQKRAQPHSQRFNQERDTVEGFRSAPDRQTNSKVVTHSRRPRADVRGEVVVDEKQKRVFR